MLSNARFRGLTRSTALNLSVGSIALCWTACLTAGLGACSTAVTTGAEANATISSEGGETTVSVDTLTHKITRDPNTRVLEFECSKQNTESCNGVDDNCDGSVDEGCGIAGGGLQFTMAWNTDADLDLYITGPNGETVSHQHRKSASGGYLDYHSRGGCKEAKGPNRLENAVFNPIRPGQYHVVVHYWGECNVGGAATASVSVSLRNSVLGTYTRELYPGQKEELFLLTLE